MKAAADIPASITCAICTHRYDPAAHDGCAACPLGAGCAMTCCPACGYSTVDPSRSVLVGLGARLARLFRGPSRSGRTGTASTLAEVPPGGRAQVAGTDALPVGRQEQLAAFGVSEGRWVDVVQQSPVTVVRVEHIELAFEAEIARGVRVAPAVAPAPA